MAGWSTRRRRALLSLVLFAASWPLAAGAAWPERPVRLIVAVAAGGPTDDLARTLGQALGEQTGGTFVVENRGGGGGRIGIGSVARADPDGYTILVAASTLTISTVIADNLPFDALRDFAPVALIATTPTAFSVSPGLGIDSLAGLVEHSKRVRLNYATPGTGTVGHLSAEWLKQRSGLQMLHVAHTGAGPALQSLLSGAVQVIATPVPSVQSQIEAGTVKTLAVTSERRWFKLPDTPTMVELGFEGFVADTFFGLMAPAATPTAIVARLSAETLTALQRQDVVARLQKSGYDVRAQGAQALAARIQQEIATWRDVVKRAGIGGK